MRPSFAFGVSPMIVGVIRERTPRDAIAEIKNGEVNGARGFDLHLDALDAEYRTKDAIAQIVQATDKPILALNYNNGYYGALNDPEEVRIDLLRTAALAGVSAVDLQGYSYDRDVINTFQDDEHIPAGMEFLRTSRPGEVALKPDIVKKQQEFVEEMHGIGAEVLISMHFKVHLPFEQLSALARHAHDIKGADIVKMVTPCQSEEELAECLASTVRLKKELGFPFSYHASGKMGQKSRMICPMLGSHLMFCNVNYRYASNFEQLHLHSMTEAYRFMGML